MLIPKPQFAFWDTWDFTPHLRAITVASQGPTKKMVRVSVTRVRDELHHFTHCSKSSCLQEWRKPDPPRRSGNRPSGWSPSSLLRHRRRWRQGDRPGCHFRTTRRHRYDSGAQKRVWALLYKWPGRSNCIETKSQETAGRLDWETAWKGTLHLPDMLHHLQRVGRIQATPKGTLGKRQVRSIWSFVMQCCSFLASFRKKDPQFM